MIWLPVESGISPHYFKIKVLSVSELKQLFERFPCDPNECLLHEQRNVVYWSFDKNFEHSYSYSDGDGVVLEKEDSYLDVSAGRQVQISRKYCHPINYLNERIASEGINKKDHYSLDLVWFLFSCYKKSVVNRDHDSFGKAEDRINGLLDSDLSGSMVLECILKMYPVFMAFVVAFFDRIEFSPMDRGEILTNDVLASANNLSAFLMDNAGCGVFCKNEELDTVLAKKQLAIGNQKVLTLAKKVRVRVGLSDNDT